MNVLHDHQQQCWEHTFKHAHQSEQVRQSIVSRHAGKDTRHKLQMTVHGSTACHALSKRVKPAWQYSSHCRAESGYLTAESVSAQ